jgi:hypothetical protein
MNYEESTPAATCLPPALAGGNEDDKTHFRAGFSRLLNGPQKAGCKERVVGIGVHQLKLVANGRTEPVLSKSALTDHRRRFLLDVAVLT